MFYIFNFWGCVVLSEGLSKDEVSYGALIYNQILNCLHSARGRVMQYGRYYVYCYDEYEVNVDHLVSLVSVVGDDEFNHDLEVIERRYRDKFINDDNRLVDSEYYSSIVYSENERVRYRRSFERFNACLRLLKRKGIIVEKLLEGKL
jgi:hypothetical protein